MFRYLLAGAILLLIAAPAAATINVTNGTNPQDITITLDIDCYTNIYWNNTDEQAILFSDGVCDGSQGSGDFWRTTLTGAYGVATKSSQDAYAEGFFESDDAALFWLQTNCDATMTLTSGGNLANNGDELPTWYTVALTNNVGCTGSDCGFINGGVRQGQATVPFDGWGDYADDADATPYVMELFGGAFWPNQYSFPMEVSGSPTTYTGDFDAFAEGTILFHARVERSGISDPAGTYTTTLEVNF